MRSTFRLTRKHTKRAQTAVIYRFVFRRALCVAVKRYLIIAVKPVEALAQHGICFGDFKLEITHRLRLWLYFYRDHDVQVDQQIERLCASVIQTQLENFLSPLG